MKRLLFSILFLPLVCFGAQVSDPFSDKSTGDGLTATEMNTLKNDYRIGINNVDGSQIIDSAVSESEIAADAVTPSKLDEDSVLPFTMSGLEATYGVTCSTLTATSTTTLAYTTISDGEVIVDTATITNAVISGDMKLASGSTFYLDGGSDTYIRESSANAFTIFTKGVQALSIDSSQDVTIPALSKLYVDGGGDTYFEEGAADTLNVIVGGASALQCIGRDVSAGGDLIPQADDNANYLLGSGAAHWYGVYYGAGGLNQKACFKDNKEDITVFSADYATLPRFGEYKWKGKHGSKKYKGFVIDDMKANKGQYKYVSDDGQTMELGAIIAQMAECIRDLNKRVAELEKK